MSVTSLNSVNSIDFKRIFIILLIEIAVSLDFLPADTIGTRTPSFRMLSVIAPIFWCEICDCPNVPIGCVSKERIQMI